MYKVERDKQQKKKELYKQKEIYYSLVHIFQEQASNNTKTITVSR